MRNTRFSQSQGYFYRTDEEKGLQADGEHDKAGKGREVVLPNMFFYSHHYCCHNELRIPEDGTSLKQFNNNM